MDCETINTVLICVLVYASITTALLIIGLFYFLLKQTVSIFVSYNSLCKDMSKIWQNTFQFFKIKLPKTFCIAYKPILGPQFRKIICFYGLNRSRDCFRLLFRRRFHTTMLFGAKSALIGPQEHDCVLSSQIALFAFSSVSSRYFFHKTFPIIIFFSLNRAKLKKIFCHLKAKKRRHCYKIVYFLSSPISQTLEHFSPLLLLCSKE